jgi:hypothetical protein
MEVLAFRTMPIGARVVRVALMATQRGSAARQGRAVESLTIFARGETAPAGSCHSTTRNRSRKLR